MFSFLRKSNNNDTSSGVFEYKNSQLHEIKEGSSMSINDICSFLGHHPDSIFTYFYSYDVNSDYQTFHFKVFTKELVLIRTNKRITKPNLKLINSIIDKLAFDELYNPTTIEHILEEGIESQSLTTYNLCENLKLDTKSLNGIVFTEKLGLYLEFNNGILESFQTASGLNTCAKDLQKINPKIIESYFNEAEKYWGTDKLAIYNEINVQADSAYNLPSPSDNPFKEQHRTKFGNINFFNILICHYEKSVTKDEFLKINHGRFTEFEDQISVQNFIYKFDNNGNLQSINRRQ